MNDERKQEKISTVQSVDVCIDVLLDVAKNPDCRLADIARNIGETKPRILRMLRTMERRGLVRKSNSGTYRLGNTAIVLGTAASTQVDLVRIANPILEELGQKVNETTQLRIIDNGESLCIAKFEPTRDLRVHSMIGRRRPLHAGSYKVLLAYLPPQVQAQMIPDKLERFTARTITTRARLEAELKRVRDAGHCVSRGEVSDQLVSVSVPVLAFDGSVIAAVNIAAPAFRTQDSDIQRYIALLKNAARKISEGLGW
ncbi:helix-turn-helix domain-containing protein [Sinorhizobium meliloti]|uniref:IclR family transcriptional regulator n=1 Tax=Rhizobium meliloti TaxID=382 RepID=UPI000C9A065A|nr:IclR family transcriptional regulator [Sinorhizobium meliloti]MDW9589973.1 helix-turn-helix domain-containing protein [Sinorhizobium meliloti]MDW9856514.1 helix-turn-helix domain-containing protein [Sinorhizobium meliloti]MDW9875146.1 helix-turn-helix domain-containing protein [Sinorhizobium meliloti]MDW9887275.1 helix-turn-helix domain-containing protein [Sinorhizobium meliloti]MDX0209542.1 helix-turn-helix domain-containing protein [Sinorhizobium meliloti]